MVKIFSLNLVITLLIISTFLSCLIYIILIYYWNLLFTDNSIDISKIELNNSISHKKYAIYSVSTLLEKDFYLFHIPLTALAWRKIDYEPIVMIIKTQDLVINDLAKKVIEYLEILNIKIIEVQSKPGYEVMTSMVARLLVGLLPNELVGLNDHIISTDSDLFPVNKNYYSYKFQDTIKIYNAKFDLPFMYNNFKYKMYPLCHVGMSKKNWKLVMGLDENQDKLGSETVFKIVKNIFDEFHFVQNSKIKRGSLSYWYMDQKIISIKIQNYLFDKKNDSMENINNFGYRLDRGYFKETYLTNDRFNEITDFHSFHEDVFIHWDSKLMKFLKLLFNNSTCQILNNYFVEYNAIRKKKNSYVL